MSKIYELLVETAKRAERETGGKTSFCTLQVFANGAAFADGVKYQLASGADESELIARLSERLASNKDVITEHCGCRFNWNDKFYESRCDRHTEAVGWQDSERFGWTV